MGETNFSLLTQEEIDILVSYLTGNNKQVESQVLTQDSIDKLIHLMRKYRIGENKSQDGLTNINAVSDVLGGEKDWYLEVLFEENAFLQLYAKKQEKMVKITPRGYSAGCFVEDESQWGYAISPGKFCSVASVYGLSFTKATYEKVIKRYAKINFGDENYALFDVFEGDSITLSTYMIE